MTRCSQQVRKLKVKLSHQLTNLPLTVTDGALVPGTARSQSPSYSGGPIQAHEIAAALPADGITIGALFKKFPGRIGDISGQQTTKKEFILLVKENSFYDKDNARNEKLLRPLPPK